MPAATASASATKKASSKNKLIVTLKLSPKTLTRFAPPTVETPADSSRTKSVSSATPSAPTPSNAVSEANTPAAGNGAETGANATPVSIANGMLAPPPNAARRKGIPGPKPGMKRTASQLEANGVPKPRGKPGPKKKQRLDENGQAIPGTAPAAPKLGPKANQGAINACLRALDRTGKPCRKWNKKAFTLKSFTGFKWDVGSAYATTKRPPTEFAGDVKSDSSTSGDVKPNQDSSALPSEKSTSGVDADMPTAPAVLPSSPSVAINASA